MNFCEKTFQFGQNVIFLISFDPFAPVFPWFVMSCDIDSTTRDFRLDSSHLFHLSKFS